MTGSTFSAHLIAGSGKRGMLAAMVEDTRKTVTLFRHGETEWSRSGQHTSITDLPLTEKGRAEALQLQPLYSGGNFSLILSSPRRRALETAELAGAGKDVEEDADLAEWYYGDYEGLTTAQIRSNVPDWTIFTHPVPGGETGAEVAARCDRVIDRAIRADGDVALFAHGHLFRVFVARWLRLGPEEGWHFAIGTATRNLLGYEHENRAVLIWNAPTSA